MSPEEARAREAIRTTLARNELAESRGRLADAAATFTQNAVLVEGRHTSRGRTQIHAFLDRLRARPQVAGSPAWPHSVQREVNRVSIQVVNLTAAFVRSEFEASSRIGFDHRGWYDDVLHNMGGEWLIAGRQVRIDAAVATSAVRGSLQGPRRETPATRRPAVAGPSVSRRRAARVAS